MGLERMRQQALGSSYRLGRGDGGLFSGRAMMEKQCRDGESADEHATHYVRELKQKVRQSSFFNPTV